MIIHCTRYANVDVEFWMVVTETRPEEGGVIEEHHGVAIWAYSPTGQIRQNEQVYVEHNPRDEWEIVEDDDVPDFVWKAYGEWLLAGAENA